MSKLTICLIICMLTCFSYLWGKFTLATTAMISMMLFLLTGCVEANAVLSSFGNSTGIMMVAMFVVAAGFSRTQFVKNLAGNISKVSKGSLTKVLIGYMLVAVLLCQFIQSNLIPFCILYPLLMATVEDMGVKPSKVMYSLGLVCIITTGVLPLGGGATVYAEMNGYLEANGADVIMAITDPMKARLPLMVIMTLYAIFLAPKFAPDNPVTDVKSVDLSAAEKTLNQKPLPPFQEKMGYLIFFGVSLALLFSAKIGLPIWEIAIIGAILVVVTGVLPPKEATQAMPIWVYLLYVGSIVMANALSVTGAGEAVGNMLAGFAGGLNSNILIYLMFFIVPFIVTQFIFNRSAMLIFYPIVIQTCLSLGANPIGPVICVQAACLSAFVTPMATGTVSYFMGAGGYDLRSVIKMSLFPILICCTVSVVWSSIAFPLF